MDNSPHYRVVFAGRLLDGFEADEVKQSLASQLQLSPAKVAAFFSGEKQVLKRTVTLEQAQRYAALFTRIGLAAIVETLGETERDAPAGTAAPEPEARPLPPLRPVRSRFLYKPLLGLAALCNVAMFLLYLATLATLLLVLLNPYALAAWLFASLGNPLIAAAIYALTLVFGLFLTALLAKPLLALHRVQYPTVPLSPQQEPDLFEFVADVCEIVGTAPPREILLSNDATLDMRFQDDVTAAIEGRTTLILGLPLAASLNVRQLAAALAQTAYGWGPHRGARTSRFLQRYAAWLLRAGDGTDFVDRRLLRWQRRARKNRYLVDSLLRLCRWARLPLAFNLRFGRLLAGRALQRRVADADAAARRQQLDQGTPRPATAGQNRVQRGPAGGNPGRAAVGITRSENRGVLQQCLKGGFHVRVPVYLYRYSGAGRGGFGKTPPRHRSARYPRNALGPLTNGLPFS